ncbi:MAG: trimethylamine methyltransferase family protein, partial [Desulfobacterales bacterium]
GPGGHFISARHTRRHMRSELYKPQHSDRENRDRWQKDGAEDSRQRATGKAQEILARPSQSVIPSDIRERIKQEIPGIRSFIME